MSTSRFHTTKFVSLLTTGAVALGSLWPTEAPACGPPPPQGDCAAQLTCVLGSPRLVAWPPTDGPDLGGDDGVPVEIPTRIHISQEYPPEGEVCYPLIDLTVDTWLDCSAAGASTIFSGSASLSPPSAGRLLLPVPMTLDESELTEVVPGDCRVSGKANMTLSTGAVIEVKCGPTVISWVETADDAVTPLIEASFQSGEGPVGAEGHYTAVANVPQQIRVQVRNNHATEGFSGEIVVVTENANHMGEVIVEAGGGFGLTETITTSLSEGEGDDFVVQSDASIIDGCFELPLPEDSISPVATGPFSLEPGEETVVGFWTRAWPTCPDGSCSGITYEITGSFDDGDTLVATISGSLMVDPPPDELEEPACEDVGETTTVDGCEDEEEDDCGGEVVAFSSVPTEIRAGLIFDSNLIEARPAVVNTATTASVELIDQEIEEDNRAVHSGRINEILWLADGVAAEGEHITLSSQFSVVVIDGEGEFEISEVVVGSKHQPEDDEGLEPPSSFIGLGRIEVSTSPFTEITAQYQAGVWTIGDGRRLPLEVVDYDMTADGAGFATEVTLVVPDGVPLDVIYLTHDIRGYSWLAYENVCDDGSDNDNDGLVDCDDEDCDGHPACDETEEGDDTGEPTDPNDDDPEDDGGDDPDDGLELGSTTPKSGGCGCSASQGGLGLGFLLPALIALVRRERNR